MARKPGSNPQAMKNRAAKTAAAMASGSALAQDAPPKKKTNLFQLFREVRAEARKITWTSRKETWITTVMVGIMVALVAIFLSLVDWVLATGMRLLLSLVNGG
ncbi:MAG: preprotein translocase subunit SecE [Phenylobacterium sp.]|uniref:preprotein translocase subunit SecE n=1 Tax=Phenylobacterium sp. TaxID=1871053 RepID=UPI00391B2EB7